MKYEVKLINVKAGVIDVQELHIKLALVIINENQIMPASPLDVISTFMMPFYYNLANSCVSLYETLLSLACAARMDGFMSMDFDKIPETEIKAPFRYVLTDAYAGIPNGGDRELNQAGIDGVSPADQWYYSNGADRIVAMLVLVPVK